MKSSLRVKFTTWHIIFCNLGNNLYGDDIKYHLEKIKDSNERSAYILMERIFPWPQKNHLLKVGKDPRLRDVISELGIFGVYLG